MTAEPILSVAGVSKRFGGVVAVNEASFDVAPGSITGLIGPNGAGKTTMFNCISGFLRPERGAIHFDGWRCDGRQPHALAAAGLVRTFQIPRVLTRMTVLENMMLAGTEQPGEGLGAALYKPRHLARREREIREQARELLNLVRLSRLAGDYAGTLSGGQRKLLEFGRALMTRPRMVLLDEPMAGVAPTLAIQLLEHIIDLRATLGTTILVIEHDMEAVMAISDRIVVMDEGAVIAEGLPDEIQRNERVIEAYLGTHAAAPGERRGGRAMLNEVNLQHLGLKPDGDDVSDGPDLILSVRNLISGYVDENVLHGVSIDVPTGAIVAVIGPNGCGKSTLLKTIYGLVPPRGGEAVFRDREGARHTLVGLRPHAVTKLGLNMVPQLANVFPDMSVRENLEIGAGIAGGHFAERLERVLHTFPALAPALPKRAATLSGGQRQMLGIGRALIADPQLLILDEPSAGLAPAVVDEVFARVKAINAEGVSILMVEQKARQCLALSDYGYVLDMGQNRMEGTGHDLLNDREVIDAYLGNRGRLDLAALKRG